MMNKIKLQEQELNDQLAEFTDRILSGAKEENMQEITTQDELAKLQKTVLLMKSAAQKARANSEADARIRSRLLMEWKKTRQTEHSTPKRFTWTWDMPHFALAGGFAFLVLIGIVTLLPQTTTPLTATAEGSLPWSPFLILAGVLIIVFILWRNRHDQ